MPDAGAEGSLLVAPDAEVAHPGVRVKVADTVGAGDAFTAALCHHSAARHAPGAHGPGGQPLRRLGGLPGRPHPRGAGGGPGRRAVSQSSALSPGKPRPLGATLIDGGVQFAVFSRHATSVHLLLFRRPEDASPSVELVLDPRLYRTGDIWHIHVPGLAAGQCYLYRVFGPYAPQSGHRFNPNRLLLDPYAKAITGSFTWNLADARGFDPASPERRPVLRHGL